MQVPQCDTREIDTRGKVGTVPETPAGKGLLEWPDVRKGKEQRQPPQSACLVTQFATVDRRHPA